MSTSFEYLPVTHDEIPVEKVFILDGKSYALEFNYNDVGDFYTLMVSDESTGTLLFATRFSYLSEAIDAVVTGLSMTRNIIPSLPVDIDADSPSDTQVTIDTFDEVRLCLM